jgi:hypothetical protein
VLVKGALLDLENTEVSVYAYVFVNDGTIDLVATALNDVEFAVVVAAVCSSEVCLGNKKLFDDKNQIHSSMTTGNLFLLIIDKYVLTKSTQCSILSCDVQVP